MRPSERQSEILKLVRLRGSCGIGELAGDLAVSGETIRRNIAALVRDGLLSRVHGGVMVPDRLHEPSFRLRMQENRTAKEQIAKLLSTYIKDGDTVFLDAGSTTTFVARALLGHGKLVVVTNSAEIAHLLSTRKNNRVFMAGGELRPEDGATFGPEAIAFIQRFSFRHVILSAAAINTVRGVMVYHLSEADLGRAALTCADQVVVVADSSKFERDSLVQLCSLDELDVLATSESPRGGLKSSLGEHGVRVLAFDAELGLVD